MKTISGDSKKSPNKIQAQRHGLYRMIHVAMRDLGIDDATYRGILLNWNVKSKTALSIPELEDLVSHFESRGFRPTRKPVNGKVKTHRNAQALHARIWEEALALENGGKRLAGIVKSVANVDDLRFCRNIRKLRQILKIVGIYKRQETREGEEGKRVSR